MYANCSVQVCMQHGPKHPANVTATMYWEGVRENKGTVASFARRFIQSLLDSVHCKSCI